ncbi:MAG: hypothetical protein ABI551_23625 [Polyangiaceae bacterium]
MRSSHWLGSFAVAGSLFLSAGVAHAADLSSCGDIFVDAGATCTVETSGGCEAQCTPVNVTASCSAKLQATCEGSCNVDASADCTTSCQGTCEGSCNADPGSLDCQGNCEGTCSADCTSQCASDANQTQCQGECKANCKGSCSGKCEGTPPSATCQAKCQASCSGSCTAKVNASCNIDCQAKGEASCEANVTGGCKAQCQEPKGAIFCDGQYVDAKNVSDCADALKAFLNIQVSGSASSGCDGGDCSAEAQGTVSAGGCSTAPGESPLSGGLLLGAFGLVGIAIARKKSGTKK